MRLVETENTAVADVAGLEERQILSKPIAPICIPKAVDPRPVAPGADLDDPALYFNKELSWIDFNWRVLALAMDERTPLLERVKFVAITASNLDEFVQKRVGGLKRQEAAGVSQLSEDGRTPSEQLHGLRASMMRMHAQMTAVWEKELRPLLAQQADIFVWSYRDLSPAQREELHHQFRAQIYQVLTPLAVDPGHPFPFISNLSLSLAVVLRHKTRNTTHFARLKLPKPRWLEVPPDSADTV